MELFRVKHDGETLFDVVAETIEKARVQLLTRLQRLRERGLELSSDDVVVHNLGCVKNYAMNRSIESPSGTPSPM